MWKGIAVLVVALVAFLVLFLVSMRMKFRPAQDAVRRINRVTWNPRTMRTAGQPGAFASVIRHVGRTSGRQYETPVGAVETEDGDGRQAGYSGRQRRRRTRRRLQGVFRRPTSANRV